MLHSTYGVGKSYCHFPFSINISVRHGTKRFLKEISHKEIFFETIISFESITDVDVHLLNRINEVRLLNRINDFNCGHYFYSYQCYIVNEWSTTEYGDD